MAKQFGYTASILKDTNRLIASSQANWSALRNGSYIIFDDDDEFYKVVDKEEFFYIKEFKVLDSNLILVEGSTDIRLSLNDNVSLTFKEFEAGSVEVIDGGLGFSKGDILEIQSGLFKTSAQDGLPCLTKVSIDKVSDKGKVLSASIISNGIYYEPPVGYPPLRNSLKIKLDYSLIDKRTIESRAISNIEFDGKGTLIYLNNDLPPHVTAGKISTSKWELVLNINYAGKTKMNSTYRVLVDFTPHLNMPLMRGDLNKNFAVFNEALMKLDSEIKNIKDKL